MKYFIISIFVILFLVENKLSSAPAPKESISIHKLQGHWVGTCSWTDRYSLNSKIEWIIEDDLLIEIQGNQKYPGKIFSISKNYFHTNYCPSGQGIDDPYQVWEFTLTKWDNYVLEGYYIIYRYEIHKSIMKKTEICKFNFKMKKI